MPVVNFYIRDNISQAKMRQLVSLAGLPAKEIPWPVKTKQPMKLAGYVSMSVEIDDIHYQKFVQAMDSMRTQGIIRIIS